MYEHVSLRDRLVPGKKQPLPRPKIRPADSKTRVLWRGNYPVATTHNNLDHRRQFCHKFPSSTWVLYFNVDIEDRPLGHSFAHLIARCSIPLATAARAGGAPSAQGAGVGPFGEAPGAKTAIFPQVPSKENPPVKQHQLQYTSL